MKDKTYKLQHRNGSGGEWSQWYTDKSSMTKDEANAALDAAEIGTDGWHAQYRVIEDD